jgi:hypothetical protein
VVGQWLVEETNYIGRSGSMVPGTGFVHFAQTHTRGHKQGVEPLLDRGELIGAWLLPQGLYDGPHDDPQGVTPYGNIECDARCIGIRRTASADE